MAHTKVTKTGTQNNGTANTFSYSGSFDVFKASEVEVELDNVALTFTTSTINESASPREYTVDYGNKTVHIGGANLAGTNSVVIQPVTDMGTPTPRATYTPGASVTSDDLNNNQLQLMRKAMEYDEQKLSSRGGTMTGNLHFDKNVDITFEGDTANDFETTLTVADPTSDKTITLPDTTGTVITTGDSQTITTSMIASNAINSDRLANDAVNSQHYVDGSIDHVHLSNNLIDGDNIQDDVINSEHYVAGSIDHEHLANDIIDGDNIQDGVINSEHYANGSIDHVHLSGDCVDGDNIADDSIDSEHYVSFSIDAQHLATNSVTTAKIDGDAVNGDKIADDSIDNEHIAANAVRVDQIKNAEITVAKLNPSAVINTSEQASATTNDTSLLTSAASDARYFRQDSTETIASGDTWSAGDSRIATTGAIDLRVIELVDNVGGFVPIANETSFPTENPDINTSGSAKGGTIVSVNAASANLPNGTSSLNGTTLTITNGRGSGLPVIITGVTATIPSGFGFLVETTATDHTYAFHRLVPKASEVSTVAANAVNIAAAGANVVDINNFADLYQISTSAPTNRADTSNLQVGDLWFDSSSNKVMMVYDGSSGDGFSAVTPNQSDLVNIGIVSGQLIFQEDLGLITNAVATGTGNQTLNTVAGISTDVTTVAGIDSQITAVAADATDIGAVAGKATEIGRLGTADAVADMAILGTADVVADMNTLATADIVSDMNTLAVADVISDMNTLATTSVVNNLNTVAGIATDVTNVANDATDIGAVAAKATEIGRLGTADAVADMAILGTADVVSDMNTLATADIVADMNLLATADVVADMALLAVPAVITDMSILATADVVADLNTLGTADVVSDMNTLAVTDVINDMNTLATSANVTAMSTCATNITNVNTFANRYRIASSDPGSDNDEGDLYFNTTQNELRVYNGSAWQGGVTATGNLAGLTANTFSDNQTINGNIIVSGTVDGVDIATRDTLFGGLTSSSGVLTNGVTATTQGTSDNTTKVATTAYVTTAVGNVTTDLVGDTSPQLGGALDGQNNNMSNIGTIDGSNLQLDFGTI